MPADVSTPLPELDLGPSASITVDTGNPAAIVTSIVVFGTYYPPGNPISETALVTPLFVPLPVDLVGQVV